MSPEQSKGHWRDVVREVHELQGHAPLTKFGPDWAAELVSLLDSSIHTIAVLGVVSDALRATLDCLSPRIEMVPLTLPALARYNAGQSVFTDKPDMLVANCEGYRADELGRVISLLCASSLPVLVQFDVGGDRSSVAWFRKITALSQVRVLDVSGAEISLDEPFFNLDAGCLALIPRRSTSRGLERSITTHTSRQTGVPRQARMYAPRPYTRTVEIVSLQTGAQLGGFRYEQRSLDEPKFNIYSRTYGEKPELFGLAWCRDVDLIPHPAWKVCIQDRYLVEEIGYSKKNAIFGMEFWPEFQGYWHIRRQSPHIFIPRSDGPFLLLGGDNAYYHWLLNWVPRLMAVDVMQSQLPSSALLKVVVPHSQLLQVPGLLTLLYELGVPPENVVHLHDNAVWRFEELLVPTFFFTAFQSPAVANWYRQRLPVPNGRSVRKRILISRRDARPGGPPRRRLVNEGDLAAALTPLGFECYELSALSIRQQIELFQNAEFVLGPHGAGFTNMVFSPRGTKALILENSFNHTFLVDMVNVSGGVARSLVCEDVVDMEYEAKHTVGTDVDEEIRRNRDMTVNVDALLSALKDLMAH